MRTVRSAHDSARTPGSQDGRHALRRQVAPLHRENELQRRRLELLTRLIAVLRVHVDSAGRSRLVQEHREFGIRWLCSVLGVERTRFYRWRRDHGVRARHAAAEDQLIEHIERIHAGSGGTYGAVRVTIALRREGIVVNRKRVARIVRERGIHGVTRCMRRSLTRPGGRSPPVPDRLCRDFTAAMSGL